MADGIDAARLAEIYRNFGRIQIGGFLDHDCAMALYGYLADNKDWLLTANRGEQVVDFSTEDIQRLGPEGMAKLQHAVAMGGRAGFQFCYETLRTGKSEAEIAADPSPLAAFIRFLSSPDMIAFMRTVTGAEDIAFADGHASRYRHHHFLTTHDDRVEGMQRHAAYVMNLTPQWREDWGGLLLFHDSDRNVTRGYAPGFNVLNIFAVPQPHSVSWVTPLASHPRHAITGWLRGGERTG